MFAIDAKFIYKSNQTSDFTSYIYYIMDSGNSEGRVLVWRRTAWNNSTALYGELVDLMVKDTQFTCGLANLLDSSEVDAFAKTIVNLFSAANKTLPLIKYLIYNEFTSKVMAEGEGSILRGNNIVNKIEGAYVRLIGANYLRYVLSDLVTRVVQDKDLRLEIDPRKLATYNEEDSGYEQAITNPELQLQQNRQALLEMSQMFIDRITDPQVVEEMPREIRAVADYTAESALKYAPESLAPLVGGFIMLRFFSPAIVTPEYSKLIASDIVPSRRAKRNLVLLAKVLQNVSNGVEFGGKEEFMTCMNSIVTDNKPKMSKYFQMICKDPTSPTQKWADLEGISMQQGFVVCKPTGAGGKQPAATSKWMVTTPSTFSPIQNGGNNKSAATVKLTNSNGSGAATQLQQAPTPWDGYIRHVEIHDLFDLHRILDLYREKVAIKMAVSCRATLRILELLKDLGPSPKTKIEKKKKETEEYDQQPSGNLNSGFDDFTFMLERARFLFQGPNDKHDKPVFYLIVNRVKPEVFDNINPLIAHIFKVMDSCVNLSSYTLIVDMSWCHISSEMKRAIFTHLPKLAEVFSRKYKKNIDKLFIVHPSAYTRAVIYFMRAFTSRKLKRKIHEVYNWKQLTTYIDTENIALPETSKDYITKSYRVVKVNSKGKRQERLIKFTSNSLLNIDPKTKRVQNEKRIDEIEEIASALGSIEISMKFKSGGGSGMTTGATNNASSTSSVASPAQQSHKPRGPIGFLSLKSGGNSSDGVRRYVCNHELERDHIIQDIFEAGFKVGLAKYPNSQPSSFGHSGPLPTEYRVIKVNNAGKHQERIFKLTIDSLLNLDQQRIKSENSFAGIEEVALDFENQDIVWMKYKSEPHKRKIICRDGEGKQLFEVLTEAIHKYQKLIDIQEGDLKLAAEESGYL
ncbi:Ras GTPase activation domain-containing protein [Heterostelium album PN500]|uniref:Ras GTPase activation domain-containing protein n=1 Tax=Heterostelium pallidum (strain ATCC 26659 / Pp 5 / PN500) TaxID=670386 RepID=D3BMH0_HETP5|nr:Ras GTPase activation domain-containing protein [Heterostelium album PN500]EFA77182.1 Ras GTPase activation domain-containing protein [Heterostelium album PN500]|eukprot:XP_020429311.1 Ras GTPase activation domain-containing protein [Heterostelium album PN500]